MTSTDAEPVHSFSERDRVRVAGLVRNAQLNDCTGVILGPFSPTRNRYPVQVTNRDTGEARDLWLKPVNLRPLRATPTTSTRSVATQQLYSTLANNIDDAQSRFLSSKSSLASVGSRVEVFSDSANKWLNGKIIDVVRDNEGEWLLVKYHGFRRKESPRCSNDIRPHTPAMREEKEAQCPNNGESEKRLLKSATQRNQDLLCAARSSWAKGSTCEVYCSAENKWLAGLITDVVTEEGQERLKVQLARGSMRVAFGKWRMNVMVSSFLRFEAGIRPSAFPNSHPIPQPRMNQSGHLITSSRKSYASLHLARLLVFGYVRENVRHRSEPIMELCCRFLTFDVLRDYWDGSSSDDARTHGSLVIGSDPRLRASFDPNANKVRLIYRAAQARFPGAKVFVSGATKISGPTTVSWKLLIKGTPRLAQVATHHGKGKPRLDNGTRRDDHHLRALLDDRCWSMVKNERTKSAVFAQYHQHQPKTEVRYDVCVVIGVMSVPPMSEKPRNVVFYGMRSGGTLMDNEGLWPNRSYYKKQLQSGDIVEMHLDLIQGQLSYSVNGEYLGVAFDGIDCAETYQLDVHIEKYDADISIGCSSMKLREWNQ